MIQQQTKINMQIMKLDQESSQDERQAKTSLQEIPSPIKFGLNRGSQIKFNVNLMRPGIFHEQNDDYYNTAVVTFPEPKIQHDLTKKEVPKKPHQISSDEEKIAQLEVRSYKIEIIKELQHENENLHSNVPKQPQQQLAIKAEENVQNTPSYISIATTKSSNLLNIELDESSSQSQKNNQEQQIIEQRHQETIELLSRKPNQREKVSFQEIALTHDPYENVKIFCDKPIALGKILNLTIYRNQNGLNFLWPEYQLHYQTGAPMLYCKKMMGNTTSNYYITIQKDITQVYDPYFAAKLRGNYSGSTYQVFSRGVNPKNSDISKKMRSIQATIKFKGQPAVNQPREFQVYTLAANVKYYELHGVKLGEQIGLDQLFNQQQNNGKIFCFRNRKPIYSIAVEGYILNFGGRVQKASIKNFILEDSIAHREVLMLGKNDENKFRVDVSWPLKPYVAYCICIANFDSKYVNE